MKEGYGQHKIIDEPIAYYSEDGTEVNVDDAENCKNYIGCYKCSDCGETFFMAISTHSGPGYFCYICEAKNYDCASLGEEGTGIVLETPKINGKAGDTAVLSETFYYKKHSTENTGVKWQYSTDQGQNWIDCEGGTGQTYAFSLAAADAGKMYRCLVNFNGVEYISETIPVIVAGIVEQPVDCTVVSEEEFNFTLLTEGSGWNYLWQYSEDEGETWTDTECTGTTCTDTADISMDGRLFRCVITDTDGNEIISDAAKLTVTARTSGTCGENLNWSVADGTLTISGTGDMENFAAYSSPWVDFNDEITNVSIDEGVTSIGDYAFDHSAATSITIPDSVISIGNGAFRWCQFTSIDIPENVTSMGNNVFEACCFLTSVTLPDGLTGIGSAAFYFCWNLNEIRIPDSVRSIGAEAFGECSSLTSLIIPEGVTSIGTYAFFDCSDLTSIILPDSLTTVGESVFAGCNSLSSIIIPENVTSLSGGEEGAAFVGCGSLTDVYIYSRQITLNDCFAPVEGQTITVHGYRELKDYFDSLDNPQVIFDNLDAPQIISQPEDTTVIIGEKFTFKVTASGSGLTYLWQYSTDGGETWTNTTRTRDNYGTTATNALNGRMFRCVVTDAEGDTSISDSAVLTVRPAIEITSQTDSQTVNAGELYRFRVTAVSNTGSKLTYLWQYSKTLKGWTDTTRTVNNYGTYATVGVDGKYFRCRITDEAGNVVYSTPAMVRVLSDITITEQPTDTTVASGKRFCFTVTATGSSLTYLWQYSTDGGKTWTDTTRTKNNYTTYAKKAMSGRMFRCVITDSSNNSVISDAGTLTVQ